MLDSPGSPQGQCRPSVVVAVSLIQMGIGVPESVSATSASSLDAASKQRRIYKWLSGFMFGGVILGFAPTFLLSPVFQTERLPTYLVLHGTILTIWFGTFFLQSSLVAARQVHIHRRLGTVAAYLSVLVVLGSCLAPFYFVSRRVQQGIDVETIVSSGAAVISLNLGMLVAFLAFFSLAIAYRNRGQTHKRLMLFAFISLFVPAASRISNLPIYLFDAERGFGPAFTLALVACLPIALCISDFIFRGKVHRVSVFGFLVLIAMFAGSGFMSQTELIGSLIRSLA